jgi:hypothetical protein
MFRGTPQIWKRDAASNDGDARSCSELWPLASGGSCVGVEILKSFVLGTLLVVDPEGVDCVSVFEREGGRTIDCPVLNAANRETESSRFAAVSEKPA